MTDAYVYHFIGMDELTGKKVLSTRRATLEAIKGNGEPVMETQMVVDHSELDCHGFLPGGAANQANAEIALSDEIRSLELRSGSRDREASAMGESQGDQQYMLQLESRELRKQVQTLRKQRDDLVNTVSGAWREGECLKNLRSA